MAGRRGTLTYKRPAGTPDMNRVLANPNSDCKALRSAPFSNPNVGLRAVVFPQLGHLAQKEAEQLLDREIQRLNIELDRESCAPTAIRMSGRQIALVRPACVQTPLPGSKDQDVGHPERGGGEQQLQPWFHRNRRD
jgi:hypothetical protein